MNPKQQLELGDILSLTIGSMDKRNNNDKLYAFTNIPTMCESIQQIFLGSKQSIMKNILLPKIHFNKNLSVITPKRSS